MTEKKPLVKFLIRTEYTFYSEKPFNELFDKMSFASDKLRKHLLRHGKATIRQGNDDGLMFTHYEILRGTELLAYEVLKKQLVNVSDAEKQELVAEARKPEKINLRVTGEKDDAD